MKKLIMLALIASMALPLAACGENNSSENSNTESIVQTSSAPEETSEISSAPAEPIKDPDPTPESTPAPVTTDTIESALQGKWHIASNRGGSGTFAFNAGKVIMSSQEMVLSGTYSINILSNQIEGRFPVEDKTATIKIPYTYENGALTLYNEKGERLTKE